MLYIESFALREQLAQIVSRWIVNRPQPGDVAHINRIINYNLYASTLWVYWFAVDLLARIYKVPPLSFVSSTKGDLKDFIVEHARVSSLRSTNLITRYNRFPEDFYRETPFGGRVYYIEDQQGLLFVGSSRIKRLRRIAERALGASSTSCSTGSDTTPTSWRRSAPSSSAFRSPR